MPGWVRENPQRFPPFYVRPVVKGQLIDSEVHGALKQLWPWFCHLVEDELGDPDRAGDLADELACRLSKHFAIHRGQVRSVLGICRVAATNFVGSTKERERRIEFRGLGQEIESSTGTSAPDWQEEVEVAILVDQLLQKEDRDIHVMLELRLVDETWDRIGDFLGMTAGQARLRFKRALERLWERHKLRKPDRGPA
jgi:hypothetical protein